MKISPLNCKSLGQYFTQYSKFRRNLVPLLATRPPAAAVDRGGAVGSFEKVPRRFWAQCLPLKNVWWVLDSFYLGGGAVLASSTVSRP
jgi:hypothetical protein